MQSPSRVAAVVIAVIVCAIPRSGVSQTTQPSTRPSSASESASSADQMLRQMLRSTAGGGAKPIEPSIEHPAVDATTGSAAVAPGAPQMQVLREGTFIVDRTGRLTRSGDGSQWEFTFESDGRAMRDPPVVVLPNLKLMSMEKLVTGSNRDLKFRVTGMVTEYGGRNYVLLEKVVVIPDITQTMDR